MDVRNCPKCGKLFTALSSPVCKDCEREEEEMFVKVKSYIDEHPNCKMQEVVEETGVPMKRISKYIKDGRIEISKGMVGDIVCDGCGKPIKRGRFCDKCFIKFNHEVKDMFDSNNKKPSGPKMYHNKKL